MASAIKVRLMQVYQKEDYYNKDNQKVERAPLIQVLFYKDGEKTLNGVIPYNMDMPREFPIDKKELSYWSSEVDKDVTALFDIQQGYQDFKTKLYYPTKVTLVSPRPMKKEDIMKHYGLIPQ